MFWLFSCDADSIYNLLSSCNKLTDSTGNYYEEYLIANTSSFSNELRSANFASEVIIFISNDYI